MPKRFNDYRRWLKPVFAGLMALLLLLLGVLASHDDTHFKLHQGGNTDHACPVCAVAKGLVDAPSFSVTPQMASLSFSWALPVFDSVFVPEADFSVASNRGPPAAVSSL